MTMRNAALREYVRQAAAEYAIAGGGSASDFAEWLETPEAPEEPSLWRYAAGEHTYIGYAMDPSVLAVELGCGMTAEGVDRALARLQGDRKDPVTTEDMASLWSDEMNEMVCNDADLVRESLDRAVEAAGLSVGGERITSSASLAEALGDTDV